MHNYCDGPYIPFFICPNQVLSAWTEVSIGTCRSSRRFWSPGGRDLGVFFEIFEVLGGLVILYIVLSAACTSSEEEIMDCEDLIG